MNLLRCIHPNIQLNHVVDKLKSFKAEQTDMNQKIEPIRTVGQGKSIIDKVIGSS